MRQLLTALGKDHQVLVVDNGSRDGAANLDTEFPDVRMIRLPRNFGLTRALNIGIRAAEGDYVLLLHDDVVIDGAAVTVLAAFLESRPDAGAVCPLLNSPQIRPLPTPTKADPVLEPATGGEEIIALCVTGAAIMLRTTFLRSLGHIDERYGNYGSEIELCAQVKSSNRKLFILRDITATHGTDPSPMQSGALAGDRASGTAAFLGKHYGFQAGLLHSIKSSLKALVTFRLSILTGGKIDGSG